MAVSLSKYVPQHYSSNRNEAAANENSSSNFLCKKKTIFVESEKLQKGMRIWVIIALMVCKVIIVTADGRKVI